ncbi:MAG: pyridoxal phosphate-dependent aminotransferase [Bacteroidaceae bacterium]|nr:pyridoxal phosphate-dependent aminotransferase [Bacteroidaceae bacterium]
MKYNFDEIIPRRGTHSIKWDNSDDPDMLPLWVADMDFRAAPCILEALQRRLDHGVFGYVRVPESYYQSVINWFSRRHGWTMQREHILYTTGVIPAIAAILQSITKPGDKVLMQTPVYNCFFSCLRNAGNVLVENPLVCKNHHFEIDFEDFERKIVNEGVKVFLLCNPHNPTGRVWTPEELTRMGDICMRHNVFVISDEIHNELVMPGHHYTPFASLHPEYAEHCAICTSSSKSFNIAGLQIANITVADSRVRALIDKGININETCDVNPFGVEALQAAYTPEGEEWLTQLMEYIHGNYQYLCQFLAERLPQLSVTRIEGTYLAWVDCAALNIPSRQLSELLRREAHVWFTAGEEYNPSGSTYLRINLACPRAILGEAMRRFYTFCKKSL